LRRIGALQEKDTRLRDQRQNRQHRRDNDGYHLVVRMKPGHQNYGFTATWFRGQTK
jgi:hypothetical protein